MNRAKVIQVVALAPTEATEIMVGVQRQGKETKIYKVSLRTYARLSDLIWTYVTRKTWECRPSLTAAIGWHADPRH